ncbi:MAG: hypothetical protein J6112_00450, partial [Clostridia bacterium]|nr:hypothetical protein [Clostridia bacterium]
AFSNGDKNYAISDLSLSAGKLTVTGSGTYTITVPDGQAMYILGAIVNSGAASATYNSSTEQKYNDALTGFWQAYFAHTTARAGSDYSTVGTSTGEDYTTASSDKYSADRVKVPYIVSAYTNKTGNVYIARCICSSGAKCVINITGNCNVAAGFRGIGSIYYSNDLVRLVIQKVNGNNKTITLNMRFLDYDHYTVKKYIATSTTAGFGLFNILNMNGASSDNSVNDFTLKGSVYYDILKVSDGTQSAYKFTNNNSKKGLDPDSVYFEEVLSVGGVAGYNTGGKTYYLKDIVMDGLSVEGPRYVGGLIGFTGDTVANRCWIVNCGTGSSTEGISVKAGVAGGGLVGYLMGMFSIQGASGGQTPLLVNEIQIKCTDTTTSASVEEGNLESLKWLKKGWVFAAGGLVGLSQPRAMGSTVTNYAVSGKTGNEKHIYFVAQGTNQLTHGGGTFGVTKNRNVIFTNVSVENLNIEASYAGGIVGSGISDKNTNECLTYVLNDVTVDGNAGGANGLGGKSNIKGSVAAGGIVGKMDQANDNGKGDFSADYCVVRNYNIQSSVSSNSGNQTAGAFLGYSNPGKNIEFIANIRNYIVDSCAIDNRANGSKDTNGTGGLFGAIYKSKITGYNIFITDTSVVSAVANSTLTGSIVGNRRDTNDTYYVKLAGVSVHLNGATSNNTIERSIGNNRGSASYIVFADFNGETTNQAFAGIDDGSTSADNYTNVDLKDPYVIVNPSHSIGAVKLTGDGVAASVADLPINDILAETSPKRYAYAMNAGYTSASGAPTNQATFNSYVGKLVMFRSEVPTYLGTDFPVLVLDTITREDSHKMINSYLRLLTNTTFDFGTDNSSIFDIKIYNMVNSGSGFVASATGASLRRDDGKFFMLNSSFDSGKTQFSLIDVRFLDPADSTKVAYHLYVPVFVKKVLSFNFRIAQQSDTTYLRSVYTPRFGEMLIENIGTPVTIYFEYEYTRTAEEWQEVINAGENVERTYTKKLLFNRANTNDILDDLPDETVFVLVDPNDGGKAYYATKQSAMTGNTLNLSAFKSEMTESGGTYTFSGDTFVPQNLSELMTLAAVADSSGEMVVCGSGETPTVVVNGVGYRHIEENETGTTYRITVSEVRYEQYYLSVFTQSNAVNDELIHSFLISSQTSFPETDYPSKIANNGHSDSSIQLVMGKVFDHGNLVIESSSFDGSTVMSDSNRILYVDLSAEFGLSDSLGTIRAEMMGLISDPNVHVYQSYLVQLNRKENGVVSKVILGDPSFAGAYTLQYNSEAALAAVTYTSSDIRSSQNFAEFVTQDLSGNFATGKTFTISSSVVFTYSAAEIPNQFPGKGDLPPTDDDGVTVSGASNLAYNTTGTTYSKNTVKGNDTTGNSYHIDRPPERASLEVAPIGDRIGDYTPLGINALNPFDPLEAVETFTSSTIELLPILDATPVVDRIGDYTYAKVMIDLSQKQADGTYGPALPIADYITHAESRTEDSTSYTMTLSADGKSYSVSVPRSAVADNEGVISIPHLFLDVETGSALESGGRAYANYRVNVTVVLQKTGTGSEKIDILPSHATNYVIYTNCKIIPDFILNNGNP